MKEKNIISAVPLLTDNDFFYPLVLTKVDTNVLIHVMFLMLFRALVRVIVTLSHAWLFCMESAWNGKIFGEF